MSGNISASAVLGFNRTGLETADRDMNDAIHEFKIFNITIASLGLCILTISGVFFIISYHSRRRQRNQARAYETKVGRDGTDEDVVDVRRVERTHSLRNALSLLRRQGAPKSPSGIYFIYSNPTAVTLDEDAPGSNPTAVTLDEGAPGSNPTAVTLDEDAPGSNPTAVTLDEYAPGSNPTALTADEGAPGLPGDRSSPPPPPIHHDPARNQAHSGIILDPSTFYMQL